MVLRAEDAHELTAFSPLCIFCLVICPFDNRVESVKKVLNKQRCALSTGFAIGQQSQLFHTLDRPGLDGDHFYVMQYIFAFPRFPSLVKTRRPRASKFPGVIGLPTLFLLLNIQTCQCWLLSNLVIPINENEPFWLI